MNNFSYLKGIKDTTKKSNVETRTWFVESEKNSFWVTGTELILPRDPSVGIYTIMDGFCVVWTGWAEYVYLKDERVALASRTTSKRGKAPTPT